MTEDEIDTLHGAPESRVLDIKEAPLRTDKLVEIIQSGANGTEPIFRVIIGLKQDAHGKVDTSQKVPVKFPFRIPGTQAPFQNFDDYKLHLTNAVRGQTDGYFEGFFDVEEIPVDDGIIVVISVPQSQDRPHQNTTSHRFYIRSDGASRPMTGAEVESEMAARQERRRVAGLSAPSRTRRIIKPGDVVVDASDNRFRGGATLVKLSDGPQLYMRLRSLKDVQSLSGTEIRHRAETRGHRTLQPLGRWSGANHHRNDDGFIAWSVDDDVNYTKSITQVYTDGEILGVDTGAVYFGDRTLIHQSYIAERLKICLPDYVHFLMDVFEANFPFEVAAGMSGIKGAMMPLGYNDFSEKCRSDSVEGNFTILHANVSLHDALVPFYKKLWDACGLIYR